MLKTWFWVNLGVSILFLTILILIPTTTVDVEQSILTNEEISQESKSIAKSLSDIEEENSTHIWVQDPTDQIDGYNIEIGSGYQELLSSRGQIFRHFYNETTNNYVYSSDYLVNKTNVVDGTDWVMADEYPSKFIVRLINGSICKFETPLEIINYIELIDNSTIWAIGYESFSGIMGFYLNFADTNWGHGQYLYWPRLLNGQLAKFNQPLYAIYPHVYANYSGIIYDKILNDRNLYDTPSKNPRNTLHFFNDSDTTGLYFTTYNITIFNSNWDFTHGLKYNFIDNKYHLITKMRCNNRNFLDIGMAYEITSSPQSDGTPFQPDRFVLSNDTYDITVSINEAWNAKTYLEDFYSKIEIISQNNEGFIFLFDDMEKAGFSEKYLNLHNQTFPDGSSRLVLRAGMYGYGSYLQGTIIDIDPATGDRYTIDNLDVYYQTDDWYPDSTTDRVGLTSSTYFKFTMAFDTGINVEISATSDVNLELYCTASTFDDDTEGADCQVYNIGGNGDANTMKENSLSMTIGTNSIQTLVYKNDIGTGAYKTADTTKMEVLTDYWGNNRGSSEEYISFYIYDNGAESGDWYYFQDAQFGSNEGCLHFNYELAGNNAPNVPTLESDSGNTFGGKSFVIKTNHTDDDGGADIETMYLQQFYTAYNVSIYCFQNTSSGSVGVLIGSGYLDGTPTYSHTGITNGYTVTWTLTFDWDFIDDSAYNTSARTVDDEPEWCAWTVLDSDNLFENDLEIVGLSVSIDGNAEYGGTNGWIEDGDWFRGGVEVTANGTVEYEGSSQTFDSAYAAAVDVELLFDGGDTNQIDASISSGAFSGITYTPTSAAGIDTTAYFDAKINDIPTGGSDVTVAAVEITSKRDNEDPTTTFHSITENDPHTYIYATSQTVYFSDEMGGTDQLCTIAVNVSDSSGSGIYCVTMSAWDDDALLNDTSSPYARQYSTDSSETSGSITMYSIDNVGNTDSSPVTITMTEDITDPTFSVSPDTDSQSIGYSPNTGYDDDQTIDFTASGASDGGSGLPSNRYSWNNSAWESSTTKQYTSQPEGNISLTVVLRDNVGNNATEETWIIVDTDSPTGFTISWTRVNGTYPIYVDTTNTTIFFDPGNQCNNYTTITVNNDGEINNSLFWKIEWDKNSVFEVGNNDSSGLPDNKDFYYLGDTNGTFLIRIINNAGNYQTFNYSAYDTLDAGCGEPPTSTTSTTTDQVQNMRALPPNPFDTFNIWALWFLNNTLGILLIILLALFFYVARRLIL